MIQKVRYFKVTWLAFLIVVSFALAQDFVELGGFKTPSGNIHCVAYQNSLNKKSELRCDLLEVTSSYFAKPKDCELDWGDAFWMQDRGKAALSCHGDTIADPNHRVLAYGKIWQAGGFRCDVTKARLRCTNRDGHGFELAKVRQRVF